MKRSQMIDVICDALYCHFPTFDTVNHKYIAECVLQSIEGGNNFGQGMLPPFNHDEYYRTWREGGNGHEWEKE